MSSSPPAPTPPAPDAHRGACRVFGTQGGVVAYAWVEVLARRIPGPSAVMVSCDPAGDGLPPDAVPVAWAEAAATGARLALSCARGAWLVQVTGIRGTTVDTRPMAVAVAAIRAVWGALDCDRPEAHDRLAALTHRVDDAGAAVPALLAWAVGPT